MEGVVRLKHPGFFVFVLVSESQSPGSQDYLLTWASFWTTLNGADLFFGMEQIEEFCLVAEADGRVARCKNIFAHQAESNQERLRKAIGRVEQ